MSRVFVVQRQNRRAQDGSFQPKMDLSPAERFGQLVTILDNRASPFRLQSVLDTVRSVLNDFNEDDYLLLVGNPVLIGIVTAVAFEKSDKLKFLVWDTRDQCYSIATTEK